MFLNVCFNHCALNVFIRSEYQSVWKLAKAGSAYFLTQLCKMLVLATFFPMSETTGQQQMDILGEFMKSTMDLSDLLGLHLLMTKIPGRGEMKVLVAGLGMFLSLVHLLFLIFWDQFSHNSCCIFMRERPF